MYGGYHERRMDMEPLVAEDAGRMKGYDVSGHEDARIDAHIRRTMIPPSFLRGVCAQPNEAMRAELGDIYGRKLNFGLLFAFFQVHFTS